MYNSNAIFQYRRPSRLFHQLKLNQVYYSPLDSHHPNVFTLSGIIEFLPYTGKKNNEVKQTMNKSPNQKSIKAI